MEIELETGAHLHHVVVQTDDLGEGSVLAHLLADKHRLYYRISFPANMSVDGRAMYPLGLEVVSVISVCNGLKNGCVVWKSVRRRGRNCRSVQRSVIDRDLVTLGNS